MTAYDTPMPGQGDDVKISGDSLAVLTNTRSEEFEREMKAREDRARVNAALIEASAPARPALADDGAATAWQDSVRAAMARTPEYARAAAAAVPDLQLFARPWPWQRVNASPGQTATADLGQGETHVGLGIYFTTGAAGGSAEMGGGFRLGSFADYEFRTTVDYRYDWYFSTAVGGADSQGWVSVIVDELLDGPGAQWHSVLNRRFQLWSDSTGSGGSDGASDPGNRITVNERFRGRPDASYVWWVGGNETIQTEFQAASQANLYVDLSYLVAVARV
ncbi:hypothetical protein SAMN06272735_1080 [Streptomyces sp. TLI_55]|uniref:hypothetical protein n=1 Tax=Streptomyces sp. TLI_55 TaxID=1938861 RepID=UPI000BD112CD|nr:hypothetical protein [Streptomyces sp. TLI_55]SNX56627.1 hypothetical protein SAMN06272735_1080 [Streptomyces sp. TLI_55]